MLMILHKKPLESKIIKKDSCIQDTCMQETFALERTRPKG